MLHIVDDEEVIRDSLSWLATSRGIRARSYGSAADFLMAMDADTALDQCGDCMLLDVRMPDISGVALFDILASRGLAQRLPVIFLTGHGDVPMAVEAMRAGAMDFLQKPFKDDELIRRVQAALDEDARHREQLRRLDELRALWDELTPREQEIARRLADGQANKVMASELGISERTVEVHRARVLQKLGVRSVAQLVRILVALDGATR